MPLKHNIVIDTNVLVAGLRSRRGTSFRLLQLFGDARLVIHLSVPVALEYEDVLKREFMNSWVSKTEVDSFLDYLFSISKLVEAPFRLRPALRDPDDDRILELAVRVNATIITFNIRDFLGSEAYGVRAQRPLDLLRLLGESE